MSDMSTPDLIVEEPAQKNDHHLSDTQPSFFQEVTTTKIYVPRILLISEESDLHTMVLATLQNQYRLTIQTDGLSGVSEALSKAYDLIILDTTSPLIDADECLRFFKTEQPTCQIPIFMLGARQGAIDPNEKFLPNAFIQCPIESKEFLSACSIFLQGNLLGNRKCSHPWKSKNLVVAEESDDNQLVVKALAVIRLHYQNGNFRVEDLAEELAMSRRHLHRRLCDLIGISPNQLIRICRIQQAIKRLYHRQGTISQICYSVGFSQPSYFSVKMREILGMTPQEIALSFANQ